MPRDSNQVYTLPEAAFQPNTTAQPNAVNNNFSDIATELTASFTRGETTPFTRTLLDDTSAAAARTTLGVQSVAEAQAGAIVWGGTAGGTANAITVSLSPAITAYSAGQTIRFLANANNTGATTLNVNGVGATAVLSPSGAACTGGEIRGGLLVVVTYNGTAWLLHDVLSTPLLTTTTGILGSLQRLESGSGASLVAPSGGRWAGVYQAYNAAGGTIIGGPQAFEVNGGATIQTSTGGVTYMGWAVRIP